MKKLLAFALIMLLAAPCFGAVAISDKNATDGEQYVGEATSITIEGQKTTFDGSKVTILANGHKSGVTAPVTAKVTNISGSAFLSYGVINFADSGSMTDSGGASRSITIADGTPGQMITITFSAFTSGTTYITDDKAASGAIKKTGWDDIAFNAALDCVTLLYVDDTTGWVVIGGNSVTIT